MPTSLASLPRSTLSKLVGIAYARIIRARDGDDDGADPDDDAEGRGAGGAGGGGGHFDFRDDADPDEDRVDGMAWDYEQDLPAWATHGHRSKDEREQAADDKELDLMREHFMDAEDSTRDDRRFFLRMEKKYAVKKRKRERLAQERRTAIASQMRKDEDDAAFWTRQRRCGSMELSLGGAGCYLHWHIMKLQREVRVLTTCSGMVHPPIIIFHLSKHTHTHAHTHSHTLTRTHTLTHTHRSHTHRCPCVPQPTLTYSILCCSVSHRFIPRTISLSFAHRPSICTASLRFLGGSSNGDRARGTGRRTERVRCPHPFSHTHTHTHTHTPASMCSQSPPHALRLLNPHLSLFRSFAHHPLLRLAPLRFSVDCVRREYAQQGGWAATACDFGVDAFRGGRAAVRGGRVDAAPVAGGCWG